MCQKRLTREGGNCTKLGQNPKNTFSRIKTQTFTIQRSTFVFFSIKKALKITKNISICRAFLTRLATLSSLFLTKINSVLFSRNHRFGLKNQLSGYVLILVLTVLPILLFGAKYVLDYRSLADRKATGTEFLNNYSTNGLVKMCAQEAALAVAQKWNPALTYAQQKESMLRIADEIYNGSPTYIDTLVTQAIPKIDIPGETVTKGGKFEPLKISKTADPQLSPSSKQIKITTNSTTMTKYYTSTGSSYNSYRGPVVSYGFYRIYNLLLTNQSKFTTVDNNLVIFVLVNHQIYKVNISMLLFCKSSDIQEVRMEQEAQ